MIYVLANALFIATLFVTMVALEALGKYLGERRLRDPGFEKARYGSAEAAVFGLLGLFVAFAFSGAASRFESRHHLIADEANAIGTAWLRIDLLPPDRQRAVRDLFRQYLDARLDTYRKIPDWPAVAEAAARATSLQHEIWATSIAAATGTGQSPSVMLVATALNEMIDITTTRTVATQIHPPAIVYIMLGILALVGAVFVGYGTAGPVVRSRVHTFGFAAALAMVMFVIIELEFPRLGLVRIDRADQVLIDLRRSMQ